ncbi:MAG TPA: hypothetical protein VFO25_08185 [Candidatus Eremiobacteraceae bacterium]|nr:hypothetical protein [Candidatus Eremiobacteraceae bacterium]
MPDRTLSADELVRRLVGDDLRPPPLALYLQIETDDGKVVNAIISGDGSGPVTATVSS